MLNALKLNMTGLVSLTSANKSAGSSVISIAILTVMINVIPIALTIVLYKNRD